MSRGPSTRTLDHIVHLTPPGTLPQAVQQFRRLGFTCVQNLQMSLHYTRRHSADRVAFYINSVVDGGEHAGGLTANALVILPDGVYLELIHFIRKPSPEESPASPWANKPPGFIAFAFLGSPGSSPSITSLINNRAEALGISHELECLQPTSGGRTRPDGERLEWEIVAPVRWAERQNAMGRPFYCGDVTPRKLRVPLEEEKRDHVNKTRGIAYLRVLVSEEAFELKTREIQAVLGVPPLAESVIDNKFERAWELQLLDEGGIAREIHKGARLVLSAADKTDADEVKFVEENGTGVFEVGFAVKAGGGSDQERTPYGRVAWVVV
ncbi:glyoxalase-like domain-containing protein [Cytidiella melzeri]|nr:glyoxalase-like domain-containing protein [Cytidiella melzeri]